MSEPPLEAQPDGVQPKPARIGHRWLDLSIAAIAIVISLISLAVGFYNAQSQQRMVAATSWPFLDYGTTEFDKRLTLRIGNEGLGPARLEGVIVRYRGHEVHGLAELLTACCGLGPGAGQLRKIGGVTWQSPPDGLYRPGQSNSIVILDRTPVNAAVWDRLEHARLQLSFEACYCSVLNDCWESDLDPLHDPKPVSRCEPGKGYGE